MESLTPLLENAETPVNTGDFVFLPARAHENEDSAHRPTHPASVRNVGHASNSNGGSEFLFPGDRNPTKPMSNMTILKALERMGFKGRMTGHSFRGLASTILHEQGYNPRPYRASTRPRASPRR